MPYSSGENAIHYQKLHTSINWLPQLIKIYWHVLSIASITNRLLMG